MSQRQRSQLNYGSAYSPSRTERPNAGNQREDVLRPQQTQRERQLHSDSPTRHDVDFYIRKVNRYEVEIARLEHDLSVTKFKLSKAEDHEIKYDILFKENQKTVTEYLDSRDELQLTKRDLDKARLEQQQASQQIRALKAQVENEKKNNQDLLSKKEQLRNKSTNQGQQERELLRENFTKEIDNLKRENRDIQEKLKKEINQLKGTISLKETIQSALTNKLEHIKKEKNSQISRLKQLVGDLRTELGETHNKNEQNARSNRSQLINETEDRLNNVRTLGQQIQETLSQQISNLKLTLTKKNNQILFLIQCDKKQLQDHQNSQNGLKALIAKLQDKIFTIQRENQLQLYNTISRMKNQYQQNLNKANNQWEQIRLTHTSQVQSLKKKINEQNKQIQLLNSENRALENQHKHLSQENEHSVQMLSQKLINMAADRDNELKNYTTSMKQIEDDAKTKLDDLHTAIQNKNTQTQILQAQITLKNGQIKHLLEEISRLRQVNREKIKSLENTNAAEQNALNNQLTALKKNIFELKRTIHELQGRLEDDEAEHQLTLETSKNELQTEKEANQLLKSRNNFLAEWCAELERDLKAERVSNVNILHDQNMTHRQNVQLREQVRVQIEATKNKEVEQIRNIHKLEKNRLQSELAKREHQLRDKKQELGRLLVQYKSLEAKVGKSSKVDRSAEDEGKCRATLEAQILLTENIFNAINIA